MCLAEVGVVVGVAGDGRTAEVDVGGRRRTVSLAPLVLDGRAVAVGDRVVLELGLVVEIEGGTP